VIDHEADCALFEGRISARVVQLRSFHALAKIVTNLDFLSGGRLGADSAKLWPVGEIIRASDSLWYGQ